MTQIKSYDKYESDDDVDKDDEKKAKLMKVILETKRMMTTITTNGPYNEDGRL